MSDLNVSVKIEGASELSKTLLEMMNLDGAKSVVKEYTAKVYRKAVKDVPKDTHTLQRSHTTEIEDEGLTGIIQASTEYATFVHEGTASQRPQPWLKEALQAYQNEFTLDVAKSLRPKGKR